MKDIDGRSTSRADHAKRDECILELLKETAKLKNSGSYFNISSHSSGDPVLSKNTSQNDANFIEAVMEYNLYQNVYFPTINQRP